ncbi:hypothetical protein ACLKMH_05060 [Psychromonas sp. KJ10-10]|uniref:hypothetical protein n=1 Tax=Psychromonas sp. KJ10-10 TaxID=3391823 RepID=UPI0039B42933
MSIFKAVWQQLIGNMKRHFMEIFPIAVNVMMLAIGVTIYQLLYSQLSLNHYVAISLVLPWIQAGGQLIADLVALFSDYDQPSNWCEKS